jgi:hypothetical protein
MTDHEYNRGTMGREWLDDQIRRANPSEPVDATFIEAEPQEASCMFETWRELAGHAVIWGIYAAVVVLIVTAASVMFSGVL